MIDVVVIIVSWNVCDLLARCIASVQQSLASSVYSHQIVVVDNASSDGSVAMLQARYPAVTLIEAGANIGFAAANNLALHSLNNTARYYLLLNPDTEVVGAALPLLLRFLDANQQFDVVGPQLRYGDASIQSSRRRFPCRATFFWESTLLTQWWPTNPWARRYHLADRADDQTQPVDWLVGAALLVRREAVERAGLLDADFFMYSEELEWQWRIQRTANRPVIAYLPTAMVIHYEGRSSEQVPAARHKRFQRSKLRLAAQHYGYIFAQVLRLFVLVCYLWQLVVEAAKWLLGHRRSLRQERITAYWLVLRDGLPLVDSHGRLV